MAVLLLIHFYGFAVGALACVLTGYFWAALLAGAVLTVSFEGTFFLWSTIAGHYLDTMPDSFYQDWLSLPVPHLWDVQKRLSARHCFSPAGACRHLPDGRTGPAAVSHPSSGIRRAYAGLSPLEGHGAFLGLVGGTLTGALVWYTAGTELSLRWGCFWEPCWSPGSVIWFFTCV